MSLSPEWAKSVVVRSEGNIVAQHQQAPTAARTYAVAGRPIIVRRRDPRVFTAEAATSAQNNGGEESRPQGPSLGWLVTGRDVAETFWVPDVKRNEASLLETMYRRTAANRTHVLLHSRPLPELQYNFSTCTGENIDLSHDVFRLSKTSMAILQMERHLSDGDEILLHTNAGSSSGANVDASSSQRRTQPTSDVASITGKTFKDQLRHGLRYIHEEEYYLVRYRDYSAWAVQQYAAIAKKDHYWGKKYVEQCFAVHVGKEPGELIPITEAQFLFGVELLQRQLLEQVGTRVSIDINYSALSKDQFRSLGVLLGDGMRAVAVDGEERRRQEEEEEERRRTVNTNKDAYVPPSMWDWSPSAIKKRIDHQLQLRYQALGRFVVRIAVLGVGLYVAWSYVRPALPIEGSSTVSGGRAQRRGQRSGRGNVYADDGDAFVPKGFLRSVLLGPKEVFDYLLAPAS
ncbi:hypothetical protein DQ04_09571000 [Trypanosoma grayi]|uniref:hypothetical protein n=1 Tax=Trypanosoma grayi TaxID=71804 RepID=UPI0004F45153|nr:hypothetical protein DQ04_09571000 [Trypanosoma grayi]KEG07513.1 hypothetical protein DQ04_09571000 [Trypanosoma grayi]